MATHPSICSCGLPEHHPVARRKTADGITVQIWSDGAITSHMGTYVLQGSKGSKLPAAVAGGWLLADQVCLYDWSEVRQLALACRKAVTRRA